MNALIILQSQKWGLSSLDRSTIESSLILKKKGIIKSIRAVCITQDSNILKYALSLGIDHGIQINSHTQAAFDQIILIKPHIKNIDCILLSNSTDIYGHLGQILAGMLNWEYIDNIHNISKQTIVSISTSISTSHPSIESIIDTKPISIKDSRTCNSYKLLQKDNHLPLKKLFHSADAFIKQLVEDGVLL